ncbi:hypothetical protein SAMN06272735_4938 [Streptomyces sp. TLI_55]|uniref:hypothetical protein n=1 Tax=Streptomyces sp. TLI_55 TaxID=1938861 RepID=UPI000BCFF3E3|nr:hypothetical protein [Streptomyces sp. TLI_55]SNX63138.1 hypothetical protein SAMN06272735_4938 [Streptomyces sp. TLI_55]
MTASTVQNDPTAVLRVARTGWRRARTVRDKGVRTCLSAVDDGTRASATDTGGEGNIVRGDD